MVSRWTSQSQALNRAGFTSSFGMEKSMADWKGAVTEQGRTVGSSQRNLRRETGEDTQEGEGAFMHRHCGGGYSLVVLELPGDVGFPDQSRSREHKCCRRGPVVALGGVVKSANGKIRSAVEGGEKVEEGKSATCRASPRP